MEFYLLRILVATYLTSQPVEATMANGKSSESNELHVSVAANETVGTSDGQTIMIIQEDQIEGGLTNSLQLSSLEGFPIGSLLEQKAQLEKQVKQLQHKNQLLESNKIRMEREFGKQMDQLKSQVEMQAQELLHYQKREQDLLQQLSVPLDARIQELLQQLKESHEDLLHQQLAQLRRSYMTQEAEEQPFIVISEPSDHGNTTTISQVQTDSSGTYQIVMTPDGPTVTNSSVTVSSAMADHMTESGIMTTADGTKIKIVTASAFTDGTTETIPMEAHMEGTDIEGTYIDGTHMEHIEGTHIDGGILIQGKVEELETEEDELHDTSSGSEPPEKRKKTML
jgi:hypothetical protein